MHWTSRGLGTTCMNKATISIQECRSWALQLLMGFLTPNSSLWLHYVSFSLPCSVFARQHNLCLGFFSICKLLCTFLFPSCAPCLRCEPLLCWASVPRLSADYSFPACFPTHYFPHPNYLTRTEFATLVCVFLGPSSLPSYTTQHREQCSVHVTIGQMFDKRFLSVHFRKWHSADVDLYEMFLLYWHT